MARLTENKMISINTVESMLTDNTVRIPLGDDKESILVIKKTLSFREMLDFVQRVVDIVVDVDEGEYNPHYKDYLIREYTITFYSNVRLPAKSESSYNLIFNTPVYDMILDNINKRDYEEMLKAIDEKIEFERDVILGMAAKQTQDLLNQVTEMTGKLDGLFGDINSDDMASLISNLSRLESFDEREIANAVIDNINNNSPDDNNSEIVTEVLSIDKTETSGDESIAIITSAEINDGVSE